MSRRIIFYLICNCNNTLNNGKKISLANRRSIITIKICLEEKYYIYRGNNEKIQAEFDFKEFEAIKLSSFFIRWTCGLSCMRVYLEKEKAREMQRSDKDLTLDIAVNVSPCLQCLQYLLFHFVGSYLVLYELLNPMPYEVVVSYAFLVLL